MKYQIEQAEYSTLEQEVKREMRLAAKEAMGYDEWDAETICFVARNNGEFVGAIVIDIALGQICIQYLVVVKEYRNQGIGTELLHKIFSLAKERGCTFAYLETLSYQAPQFYEKHGFVLEFSRSGYAHNISFNYYKKLFK